MKKLIIPLYLIISICFLSSCTYYIQEEDARPFIEEYLMLLEEENYSEMESISYFCEDDIVSGFEELESETNLDFQAGIDIIEYTDFESHHSDSYYGMPICSLAMKANIGGTDVLMEVCVVDNEGTFNVCDIYITINDESFGIS